jgi:tetratricopeptide (TPR) repeat protein
MEHNFDNIERIIDYLNGNMTPPQYSDFETLISNDSALAAQVDEMRTILGGINQYGHEKVKLQIQSVDKNLEEAHFFEHKVKPRFNLSLFNSNTVRWLMAASVAGIVFATWFFLKPNTPKDNIAVTPNKVENPNTVNTPRVIDTLPKTVPHKNPQIKDNTQDLAVVEGSKYRDLVASSYEIPSFAKLRSSNDTVMDLIYLDSITTLMQKKDFQKAETLLKNHRFSDQYQSYVLTLKGHICMKRSAYKEAEKLFEQSISLGVLPYSEENEYYLLLCYVSDFEHKINKFGPLSKKIIQDEGHPAHDKTVVLVEKIKH